MHVQDENTIFHKLTGGTTVDSYKQYMTGKDNTLLTVLTYNQFVSDNLQFIVGLDNEYTTSIPPYANDQVLGSSDKYEGADAETIDNALTITENRFAGFGQFIYSPFEKIQVLFGARYDYSTRYGGVFNPRAGLTISPLESTKIKLIYGRAFQAPSLFYQYEQFGAPSVVMHSTAEVQQTDANWELENQIVDSYEISLTQKINENYNFKLAAYYNDLTNLIERNLYIADGTAYNKYFDSNMNGLRNENIGSQKIIGGDFLFNAKLSKKLLFYAFYSYADAISIAKDDTETAIPRIAEHKVWLGLTAQNLFDYLTISPRFRWTSDIYNANTTLFPDNMQPGYFTVDLNLSVNNLSDYFRIYANFENILDEKIEHGGLYGQSGIYTAVIPQQGFTFKVGIEILFNK